MQQEAKSLSYPCFPGHLLMTANFARTDQCSAKKIFYNRIPCPAAFAPQSSLRAGKKSQANFHNEELTVHLLIEFDHFFFRGASGIHLGGSRSECILGHLH